MKSAKVKVERFHCRDNEEIFAKNFEKYQSKALKPLLKREVQLKVYVESLNNDNWHNLDWDNMPEEFRQAFYETGHNRWQTKAIFEQELKALQELIRSIKGEPKHYNDNPEQQLYHELYQGISAIIVREVGQHQFEDTDYKSKVGYINTSGEVGGRVARSMPTAWGEYRHISDVCSRIVDMIKEVKKDYPDFYKEEQNNG